jgi:hypothetical protein
MKSRVPAPGICLQKIHMKGHFKMRKIMGVAIAVMVAAAVVWSKAMVRPKAASAQAEKAEVASTVPQSNVKNAGGRETSDDSEYGWGPFRLIDW